MRLSGITLLFCLLATWALAQAFAQDAPADEPEHRYKVEQHIFARSVHIDREGRCKKAANTQIKAWYVLGFPANIPPFESCTTIASKTARGEVDIKLSIVSKDKENVLIVDGVLDLGIDGKASQAIDWDHLKIPAGGIYHMVIEVEGKKIARFPMRFALKKKRKR